MACPAGAAMTGPIGDEELEEILRVLGQAHLEIERGLRPQDTLAQMMPPTARQAWLASRRNQPRLTGGAVDKADITIVGFERHPSGRVYATALTPTHPDRRGALCFVLDVDEHVRIRQIQRLYPARDYGRPAPDLPPPDPLQLQLRRANTERQHATAAHHELMHRLNQLPADSPQHQLTRDTAASWQRIITRLDDEIAALQQRHQQQQQRHDQRRTRRRR
jgi:hypothetical protein